MPLSSVQYKFLITDQLVLGLVVVEPQVVYTAVTTFVHSVFGTVLINGGILHF